MTLLLPVLLVLGLLLMVASLIVARQTPGETPVALVRQRRDTMNELQRQLLQAGFSSPAAPRRLTQAKLLLPVALAVVAFLVLHLPILPPINPLYRLLGIMFAAIVGYALPMMYVDRRRAAYRLRIARALPDALDLMLICIEAGQSIDAAVRRTAQELQAVHPDLAKGLWSVTEGLAAGVERHKAFSQLAEDTGNEDLRALASVIAQAVTMGTPIAHTFRVFAADLRDRRVRKVEEKANMLPTKMTLGTMMFTVPPLLILLLAPALYRLMNAF